MLCYRKDLKLIIDRLLKKNNQEGSITYFNSKDIQYLLNAFLLLPISNNLTILKGQDLLSLRINVRSINYV